jgi:hypothetical protein
MRAVSCGSTRKGNNIKETRKTPMSGFISIYTFWTLWLFVHLILALGLLGALTHQAMAVALPVRKPATGIVTRFHAVPAAGYASAVCVLYVLTFIVGSFIYTQYRTAIRIPFENAHFYKTVGFFDFKEHVATLGLVLLPAYWYFWKNAQNSEYDNARKGVTLVLAVMVWFLFIVGHILNNTRGFGS